MTDPVSPAAPSDAPLQFERAEFSEPSAAPQCKACQRSITDAYFEVNGHLLCPSCRDAVAASLTGGSKMGRFFRASLFGVGAAAAGALLYFAVSSATGYNIGLIAVAVGWMVGSAVRKGSDGRGGRFYQLLAVLLTYLSISASLAPDVYEGMSEPSVDFPADDPSQLSALPVAARIILAAIFSLGAPVLVGSSSPISVLIYGFALWEAWRRNTRAVLNIAGPFQLAPAPAHEGAGGESSVG